jgi:hypothetical protein
MAVFIDQDRLKTPLEQVAASLITPVERLSKHSIQLPHAPGNISIRGLDEQMVMLCEVLDYVKLGFSLSGLSFIFPLWSIFYCT